MYRVVFAELNDEMARADGCALTDEDLQDAHRCVEAVQRAADKRCCRGRTALHPGCDGALVVCTRTGQVLAEPITKG